MQSTGENACVLETLHLAGSIILENGGEAYRVEDTVARMGRAFGVPNVEVFAVTSGLFLTLRFADGSVETAVHRSRGGPTNLAKVDAVNQVSRQAAAGRITPAEALERLRAVQQAGTEYKLRWILLASAASTAGFAVMFGGSWIDFVASLLAGVLIELLIYGMSKLAYSQAIQSLLGGMMCTLLPLLFHQLTGLGTVEAMVAGALMPLLPGLAMTNAVQDAMRGDMLSGVGHATQAILIAALVAGGAVMANRVFLLLGGAL